MKPVSQKQKDKSGSSESIKSDGSGMRWLEHFSPMKVGPPRHVKGSADAWGKKTRSKEEVTG